jgi:hypothetical protein
VGVDPCQSGCSAVGPEDVALISDDARRFWKSVQGGEMTAGVMVDHLDTVTCRVGHKNATTSASNAP